MNNSKEHEYYSILQLTEGSTLEEIHQQYIRLSELYHPSKNPGEEKWCGNLLCKLEEAYEYLHMKHSGIKCDYIGSSNKPDNMHQPDQRRQYQPWRPDVPYDTQAPLNIPNYASIELNRTTQQNHKNDLARNIGMVVASVVIGATSMFCVLVYKRNATSLVTTPYRSSTGNNGDTKDRLYHVRKGDVHLVKSKPHTQ